MSDTPLPAEEGGRPTPCHICGRDARVGLHGHMICFSFMNDHEKPASVVSSEEGGRAKPCPFCGAAPHVTPLESEDTTGENGDAPYYTWWSIGCESCGASHMGANSERAAIDAWNRRAGEATVDGNLADPDAIAAFLNVTAFATEQRSAGVSLSLSQANELADAIRPAASVVGDASEGEADAPLDAEEALLDIIRYAQMSLSLDDERDKLLSYIAALEADRIALRSTRAALEEARKDTARVDWLESRTMDDEQVRLNYTDAWSEPGDYGSILSSGPAEFWLHDDGHQCGPTLRDAIDTARSIPSQESEKV